MCDEVADEEAIAGIPIQARQRLSPIEHAERLVTRPIVLLMVTPHTHGSGATN